MFISKQNMNARQFPTLPQFLTVRRGVPAEIVEYIYSFNLPIKDDENYKRHIIILYKHLRVLGTYGGGEFKPSNAPYINFYGYTLRGVYRFADSLNYGLIKDANKASNNTIKYIKYHKEAYSPQHYEKNKNVELLIHSLKFINSQVIKCGYGLEYKSFIDGGDDYEPPRPWTYQEYIMMRDAETAERNIYFKKRYECLRAFVDLSRVHIHEEHGQEWQALRRIHFRLRRLITNRLYLIINKYNKYILTDPKPRPFHKFCKRYDYINS